PGCAIDQHELLAIRLADLRGLPRRAPLRPRRVRAAGSRRARRHARRAIQGGPGEGSGSRSLAARRRGRCRTAARRCGAASMNAAALVNALVARGMDAAETDGKVALFTSVLDAHRLLRASAPQHVWWVPGRLEVFGKHTDYAGGRTLVCCVPRGFAVAASPREDEIVRVVDAARGERHTVTLSARTESYSGWRHYVEVTVQRL